MREVWKPVYGWTGIYEVSDRGRVRRSAPGNGTWAGRILKSSPNTDGYLQVDLCRNRAQKTSTVARLVARAFLGPAKGLEVNHKNGKKIDNRVSNLEWVTKVENMRHAYATGLLRPIRGSQQQNAKLTETKVRKMRRLYARGATTRTLAKQFSLSQPAAWRAITGETWKHV